MVMFFLGKVISGRRSDGRDRGVVAGVADERLGRLAIDADGYVAGDGHPL
jgi:hypothetical protein